MRLVRLLAQEARHLHRLRRRLGDGQLGHTHAHDAALQFHVVECFDGSLCLACAAVLHKSNLAERARAASELQSRDEHLRGEGSSNRCGEAGKVVMCGEARRMHTHTSCPPTHPHAHTHALTGPHSSTGCPSVRTHAPRQRRSRFARARHQQSVRTTNLPTDGHELHKLFPAQSRRQVGDVDRA